MGRTVPFRKIPHQSDLFLDYLDLSPKALSFYSRRPTLESLVEDSRALHLARSFPREQVAAILLRQNKSFGNSPAAFSHIEKVVKPESVAILTGQQVGIFTGPLYTIFKALTAIRLAEQLRRLGVEAIPVFWMDSEDHDLAEITRMAVLGADSHASTIDYRDLLFGAGYDHDNLRPVGSIAFSESIQQAVGHYLDLLPDSEWKQDIALTLERAYRPGATFAQSFGKAMAELFSDRGLVLFDPQDPESKRLVAPVFRKAVAQTGLIHERLVERNHLLAQAGYHTQVSVLEASTVLSLLDGGERRPLTRQGSVFGLKNAERVFTESELIELVELAPERFSPNVLLRPIVQDHLFPTVAYVGGPSEIAYFAQIQVLYDLYDRPMPALWPRASFTLMEAETSALMEKFAIEFEDCFLGKHHLVEKLITASNDSSTTAIISGLRSYLDVSLEEIRPQMEAADTSLGQALETARRKMLHQVDSLQTKSVHLEARNHRELLERAEFFLNHLYPNKNLQERQLSIHSFLARYGPPVMKAVESRLDTTSFAHQLVTVS